MGVPVNEGTCEWECLLLIPCSVIHYANLSQLHTMAPCTDVVQMTLSPDDEFLIIATDGLWCVGLQLLVVCAPACMPAATDLFMPVCIHAIPRLPFLQPLLCQSHLSTTPASNHHNTLVTIE